MDKKNSNSNGYNKKKSQDKAPEKTKGKGLQRAFASNQKLKIIPLGGLNEIGKNITAFEYGNDIIVVDCGLSFPDDSMFGIDLVIPDFSYLKKNAKKVRGVVITHGHEDHIGALPYLLREINAPVYGTPLPIGLIKNKLEEHGIRGNLINIKAGDTIKLGKFNVETVRTTHSIVDSVCLAIHTPVGTVFHTGDFKIDYTPVDGDPIDLVKLAEIGSKGVLVMLSDSTNATRPGFTESEMKVGAALETIFQGAKNRIIVSTFSSNVHRIQKIVDNAIKFNRKIAFSGRSMENVANIASELGYLKIPKKYLVDINKTRGIPDDELVIITTGSQGEPMSALARMANSEHRAIQIKRGDMVILSSTPVPGNEKMVSNVINKLIEKGANVIYSDIADTHVSGHACREELKLMHALIKPKFYMPVHGEYRHLEAAADIGVDLGLKRENIFIMNNGDCLEVTKSNAKKIPEYTQADVVMVDGLGIGDVGNIVLRDRKMLSESGLITIVTAIDKSSGKVISGPDIISRGFVYVRENEDLMADMTKVAKESLTRELGKSKNYRDWQAMKNAMKEEVRQYIYEKTKRNPVILPIFMEV